MTNQRKKVSATQENISWALTQVLPPNISFVILPALPQGGLNYLRGTSFHTPCPLPPSQQKKKKRIGSDIEVVDTVVDMVSSSDEGSISENKNCAKQLSHR